jgi:hypothetical protein
MPTLLALSGVSATGADKPLDGVDVSAVLRGREAKTPERDLYFFHGQTGLETEQMAVTAPDGWKLVVHGPDVRRAGAGGIRSGGAHKVQLFNVFEQTDRAAEKPEIVARLCEKAVVFRQSEPKQSLPPINRPPRDFQLPPKWRNPLATAPAGCHGDSGARIRSWTNSQPLGALKPEGSARQSPPRKK